MAHTGSGLWKNSSKAAITGSLPLVAEGHKQGDLNKHM